MNKYVVNIVSVNMVYKFQWIVERLRLKNELKNTISLSFNISIGFGCAECCQINLAHATVISSKILLLEEQD